MVMALVLEIPSERLNISREALLLVALVLCIAVGAVEEATTFRLAKFDEVDFFNQSLGAVLAGLSLLRGEEERQPPFLALFALSILFLGAGFYYAFR